MADQRSPGERATPWDSPATARETSRRTRTRPMSKMMARNLANGTDYLPSISGMETWLGVPPGWGRRLARRMLMIAGRIESTTTTAMT